MFAIHKGIITLYHRNKGWGFITASSEGCSEEWFFHVDNCPGYVPKLGDPVTFEIAPPISLGKKDQAVDVRPIESASVESTGDKVGA